MLHNFVHVYNFADTRTFLADTVFVKHFSSKFLELSEQLFLKMLTSYCVSFLLNL